ncbi:MAG TPA: polysaccharide export protein EpsE [Gallionella sp.]|nr:polysaccharide export protein EpsE [Gallionella sp.]
MAHAIEGNDYRLGAGDAIRIVVFQNPDFTVDARVSESGAISYPLLGTVVLGGLTISAAEQEIAQQLRKGGFVQQPQVNITLSQIRGNQVSVLGQVNRPGRYPLETFNTRVTDMLATAGGVASTGGEVVVLSGVRDGKPLRIEIDIARLFVSKGRDDDVLVRGGDALYVDRAPMFFIYGEVQRAGAYRIERKMTVMQALAQGGGLTARGTERGLKVYRRNENGKVEMTTPELTDPVQPDDVFVIRESLF